METTKPKARGRFQRPICIDNAERKVTALQKNVLKTVTAPMTFAEVEQIVGKQEFMKLGIALGKLCLSGHLNYNPPKIGDKYPKYCPV